MSDFQVWPDRIYIFSSSVRAIHCVFDAERPDAAAAIQMIALHPTVQRLRQPADDWNDALASSR